jgi:hypothetical protein
VGLFVPNKAVAAGSTELRVHLRRHLSGCPLNVLLNLSFPTKTKATRIHSAFMIQPAISMWSVPVNATTDAPTEYALLKSSPLNCSIPCVLQTSRGRKYCFQISMDWCRLTWPQLLMSFSFCHILRLASYYSWGCCPTSQSGVRVASPVAIFRYCSLLEQSGKFCAETSSGNSEND